MKKRFYISNIEAEFFATNKLLCDSDIPTEGYHMVGDIVISGIQKNEVIGWVCTIEGEPGEWQPIRNAGKWLDVKIEEINNEITRINIVNNNTNTTVNLLNEKLNNAIERLNENTSNVTGMNNDLRDIMNNVYNIQVDITDIEEVVNANSENILKVVEDINKLSNLDTQLGGTIEEIVNLKKDIEDDITSLDTKINGNVEELNDLKKDLEADINNLDTKINGNTEEINNLKKDVNDNKTKIDDLDTKIDGNITTVTNLQKEITENAKEHSRLDTKIDGNISALANLQKELDNIEIKVNDSALAERIDEMIDTNNEIIQNMEEMKEAINGNEYLANNGITMDKGIPTEGEYREGDIIISDNQFGDVMGWICFEGGNPGKWNPIYKNPPAIKKNSRVAVSEFLGVARSYYKARYDSDNNPIFVYGTDKTALDTGYDVNSEEANLIDCSTFIGLVLRGIGISDSPYAALLNEIPVADDEVNDTGGDEGDHDENDDLNENENPIWDPAELKANTFLYNWAVDLMDWSLPKVPNGENKPVRTASQIAQWMCERGWMLPLDHDFTNLEPGDIIFWAKTRDGEVIQPNRYKNISHVAVCLSKYDKPELDTSFPAEYPWKHTMLEVTTKAPYVLNRTLEKCRPEEVVMICRPDLGCMNSNEYVGNVLNQDNIDDISYIFKPGFYYLTSSITGGLPAGVTSGIYLALRVERSMTRIGKMYSFVQTLINTKYNDKIYIRTQYCYSHEPNAEDWTDWVAINSNEQMEKRVENIESDLEDIAYDVSLHTEGFNNLRNAFADSLIDHGINVNRTSSWDDLFAGLMQLIDKDPSTQAVPPTSISLNDNIKLTMKIGDTQTITATAMPANTTFTPTFITSNYHIVDVKNFVSPSMNVTSCTVVANAVGEAVITASAGNKTTTITIVVEEPENEKECKGIELNLNNAVLNINETLNLIAKITPADCIEDVIWKSDDERIATVHTESEERIGVVTAKGYGNCVITATCGNHSIGCAITVTDYIERPCTSITIDAENSTMRLMEGEEGYLSLIINPANTTDNVVATCHDKDILQAVYDPNAKIVRLTALSVGVGSVTVQCGEQKSTCNVTVIEKEDIPCDDVTISDSVLNLNVGETYDLNVMVLPEDCTEDILWSPSNSTVASVDENGVVTAREPGTCTITVSCGNQEDTCDVTVKDGVECTKLELNLNEAVMNIDEVLNLVATVLPADCTDDIIWESSNRNIATVHTESEERVGIVTAKNTGNCVITATCGEQSIGCAITVTDIFDVGLQLERTKIVLDGRENTPEVLRYSFIGGEGDHDLVTYTVNADGIISIYKVDNEIMLAANGEGTVNVDLYYGGKYKATCEVTVAYVRIACTDISLNRTSATLIPGETIQLSASVSPTGCTDEVTWKASNSNVTVNNNGYVTAKNYGSSTITATCGDEKATCYINIPEPEPTVLCKGISIDQSDSAGDIGDTISLSCTVTPSNCTESVTWTSSKPSVASVSTTTGRVTCKAEGTTVITATCGDYSDTYRLTVYGSECRDLNITPNPMNTYVGYDPTFLVKPVPLSAPGKMSISIADTSICTGTVVDHEIRMRTLKAGKTTITITWGNVTKVVNITVNNE